MERERNNEVTKRYEKVRDTKKKKSVGKVREFFIKNS